MLTKSIIAVLAAGITTSLAASIPEHAPVIFGRQAICNQNPAICGGQVIGCRSTLDVTTGEFTCVCDSNPSKLPDGPWFYTDKVFRGSLFASYGKPGQCINLPCLFDKNVLSIQFPDSTKEPLICCIYTDKDCNTYPDLDSYRFDTTVTPNVKELLGVFTGTSSVQCAPRHDGNSQCTNMY